MGSLLNDVNILITKRVGDLSRLEHIKETIENNKQLYDSDKKYIDELTQKHLFSKEIPDDTPKVKSTIDKVNNPVEPTPKPTYGKIQSSDSISVLNFCTNCGVENTQKNSFCPSCGQELNSPTTKTSNQTRANVQTNDNQNNQSNSNNFQRGTYQKLVLVGGIFGIVVTPIVAFTVGILFAIGSAFSMDSSFDAQGNVDMVLVFAIVSILVSILGIVIAYVVKKPKHAGIILIFLGIVDMIGTSFVIGIITWLLFIVAGIVALTKKY